VPVRKPSTAQREITERLITERLITEHLITQRLITQRPTRLSVPSARI
jgi:hypothetical protein